MFAPERPFIGLLVSFFQHTFLSVTFFAVFLFRKDFFFGRESFLLKCLKCADLSFKLLKDEDESLSRCCLLYIIQVRILHSVCTAVRIAAERQWLGGILHRHNC